MLAWMTRRVSAAPLTVVPHPPERVNDEAVEYRRLRKYLQERHADRVVLTFAEIEDLLGFSLPEHARAQRAWWDETPEPSTQSEAWTAAGRIATVNLLARNVAFERDPRSM